MGDENSLETTPDTANAKPERAPTTMKGVTLGDTSAFGIPSIRHRCAESGEFVTEGYAEDNPKTTVKERY